MNILLLTIKYRLDPLSPYLTNELCSGFLELGHTVTVINLDWHEDNQENVIKISNSLKVISVLPLRYRFFPLFLNRCLSWSFTSLIAYIHARKYLIQEKYDTLIMTTPLTIFSLFLLAIKPRVSGHRIALCWDVFPIHDFKIGVIPKFLEKIIKKCEERLYNSCSKVFVLSEDYRKFLKNNFKISDKVNIACSGLWGGPLLSTNSPGKELLPRDGEKVIIFGGQFVSGRGTDNFLQLCKVAEKVDSEIKVLVLSSGEMFRKFIEQVGRENISNLIHMDPLPRASYVNVISHCMAGFISLEPNTECPNFPSKIVDYARAGLPILVVDNSNPGLKDFIETRSIGYYIDCGDSKALEKALASLVGNQEKRLLLSENSRRIFEEEFDARRVASLIMM